MSDVTPKIANGGALEDNQGEEAPDLAASLVVFAFMCFYYLRIALDLPSQWTHLPTLVLESVAAIVLLRRGLWIPRHLLLLTFALVVLAIVGFLGGGWSSLSFATYHLFGFIAYIVLFGGKRIDPRILPAFMLLLVLPAFWLHNTLGPMGEQPIEGLQALIPAEENEYRINIGPPGSTIHFTAELGSLLIFASISTLLKRRSVPWLIFGAFAAYLVIFAGSRTAYIATGVALLLFMINRNSVQAWSSYMLLGIALFTTYGSEALGNVLPTFEGPLGALTKLTESNHDITAGRSWLWAFHLSLLASSPLLGVGMDALTFKVGDLVSSEGAALAASESIYTMMLAAFGISGVLLPLVHLSYFRLAVTLQRSRMIALLGLLILMTAGSSVYGTVIGIFQPFVFATLASFLPPYSASQGEIEARLG